MNTWQFAIGAGFAGGLILACIVINIYTCIEDSYRAKIREQYLKEHRKKLMEKTGSKSQEGENQDDEKVNEDSKSKIYFIIIF